MWACSLIHLCIFVMGLYITLQYSTKHYNGHYMGFLLIPIVIKLYEKGSILCYVVKDFIFNSLKIEPNDN